MLEFNKFLKGDACDDIKFYAMLTFCINLIGNKLFKIVFLFETIFIFPQHYLSLEVCMIYPDSYWPSTYLYPLWACPPLCGFGAWDFLSMAIKNLKFNTLIMLHEIRESFQKSHFRDQQQKLYLAT